MNSDYAGAATFYVSIPCEETTATTAAVKVNKLSEQCHLHVQ